MLANQLSGVQRVAACFRPTTCQITRETRSGDGWGGTVATWAPLTTTTCRVMATTQVITEHTEEARPTNNVRWSIAFAAGTDVTNKDRVVALGITYEVSGVLGPKTNEIERIVECVVIQ